MENTVWFHRSPSHDLRDLYHGLRLEVVRRHHPREVLEPALVRQLCGGGGVADLRDLEEAEDVGHHDGYAGEGRPDHPRHRLGHPSSSSSSGIPLAGDNLGGDGGGAVGVGLGGKEMYSRYTFT